MENEIEGIFMIRKRDGKILRIWFKGTDGRSTKEERVIDGRITEADSELKDLEGLEIQIRISREK